MRLKKGEVTMARKQKLSKADKILRYMQTHKKGITGKQAYKVAHSMNLPQRIYDLKKRGFTIESEYIDVTNLFGETERVKQYRLVK